MINFLVGIFMVFGPVLGYVSQYKTIEKTRNTEGFSLKVSLILFLSNILRCFFWMGKQFDITLLYQSLVMIVAQLVMLNLCVSLKSQDQLVNTKSRKSTLTSSFTNQDFWDWDSIFPYLLFLGGYTFIFFMTSYYFLYVPEYFELLGSLSLTIEATLGLPQLLQNYKKHNVKGLSFVLIASWFVGDFAKTLYFYFSGAPVQFIICGAFQLIVDVAITYQLFFYPQ
ncbi:hypothetical protein DFA_10626 [Cavenderia fasciculata]|uniref:Solute carrier family 66 member 2 n=1 Tax=Cavenderia fasciculata TaxID=261658 RepID=F4QAT0_CACFS|nr:uncharacterized protein DFA_10626 [Cavenderia fasciculata]EGG15783.1 hypothetical protein DFA_10626 [Cavenderia fasciculata]|eukprot:XP_004354530.1 hypothetical protein DFA_10626 [Cavenderia fasciculata]